MGKTLKIYSNGRCELRLGDLKKTILNVRNVRNVRLIITSRELSPKHFKNACSRIDDILNENL